MTTDSETPCSYVRVLDNRCDEIQGAAQHSAQADPAHAFFLETVGEASKVISASPAVGGGAA
ncbi:MAG: hypothetical protein DMG06_25600 [Acidobacteria bacterium]|nr:MAG: hypothetical protein DMG06_25600 [Acidobacteriota bacterium]